MAVPCARQAARCFSSRQPLTVFSEDQRMLQETVRKFAVEQIGPLVHKMDEQSAFDPSIVPALFEQGLMGVEIPAEYDGSAMGFVEACLVVEEIARVDPAVAVMVDIHNTLINRCLYVFGTDEQKKEYLPKLATNTVGSFCLSEAGSGSDAFALQARAREVDNGYRITGVKQWISNSKEAGLFIVFATVDPAKRHRGITAFLVDAGTPGLEIGQKYDKLGIRASSTCEVILNDVFVPRGKVLGNVGEGYKVAIESLNEGRIGIAAQMVGLAQGAYDVALPYIHDRKQFGSRIADFQGMKFQYAEARMELEAARLLVYNAAALKEANMPFTAEAAMAKLYAGRVAERIASQCIEWLGGYGFTKDYAVEKFFRDSKIGSIYEGTSNIQLETIAKLIQADYKSS
ncbi:unnamed protein product [Vitrella brassicaformis CCMP3155]|uniref:Short/branched chain specific acyl-CoA dehydrogenase, mitochondrial n=2 Tax=Vitrella brassicaformis TaxID=1169539 RepID=A0A0G4EUN4_VITBC|nr:unnamed protein product [Vitrella brassicaformis CCMP3155]|eukprot:CEM02159.1 unnamed protein product [Vitrella brassicaformis CCMP3155]